VLRVSGVGPTKLGGPTLGLAALFLIQTEEAPALNLPWLAVDNGDGAAAERRPRGRTRVHSLAWIICSTKVVSANTGILTPGQLGFREDGGGGLDGGGLTEEGSSDATSQDVLRRVVPHSRASEI
jgi:hypothetical protein